MTYDDYLQHWGILGMKWGQRNGPPYPLRANQMSALERKKNKLESKLERVKEKEQVVDAKLALERERSLVREKKKEIRDLETNKVSSSDTNKKSESVKEDGRRLLKESPKKLTDDQLKQALDRAKNEKELRALNASNVANGKKFVSNQLLIGGTLAISTFVSKIARAIGDEGATRFVDRFVKKPKDDDE